MAHARTRIRNELINQLASYTGAGDTVSLAQIINHQSFPSVNIVSESDEVAEETLGGNQTRNLDVSIEIRVKQDSDIEATIDTIAAEVETALAQDETLNSSVETLSYTGMEVSYSDDMESLIGMMTMRYTLVYRVNKYDPSEVIA